MIQGRFPRSDRTGYAGSELGPTGGGRGARLEAVAKAAAEYRKAQAAERYHRETGWWAVLKTDAWEEALEPFVSFRVRAEMALDAALAALVSGGES